MDMTISPILGDIDRERLRRARRINGNPVLLAIIGAAFDIDAGEFRRAQATLLDAINGFTADGAHIPVEAHVLVDIVRQGLTGRRLQECTLRCCLDLEAAMHAGCSARAAGERIGHLCHALAQLIAEQWRLRLAA